MIRVGCLTALRLGALAVLSALACLGSPAAFGEESAAATSQGSRSIGAEIHGAGSYGAGLGAIALGQSILGGARPASEQPANAPSTSLSNWTKGGSSCLDQDQPGGAVAAAMNTTTGAAPPARMMPDQIDAALDYEPDPEISVQIRDHEVDAGAAQDPAYRAVLEKVFADDTALRQFESLLAAHGYSSHNLADAIAGLTWTSWQLVNDAALTDTQIRGIHRQIRAIFLANPNLLSLTAEARQRLSENAAYRVMIATAAMRADDPAVLAKSRHNIAVIVRHIVDLDLVQLDVTPDGRFSRREAAAQ
jgi:hypothetical protein